MNIQGLANAQVDGQKRRFMTNMTSVIAQEIQHYLFITNDKGHWVYYLTGEEQYGYEVPFFEIPYYVVHWENEKINEKLYNANSDINGQSINHGEKFVKDYIDFYDHILRNLTRFSLVDNPDDFDTYSGFDNIDGVTRSYGVVDYQNKCREFSSDFIHKSGVIDQNGNSELVTYFIVVKQELNNIINNVRDQYTNESNQIPIPPWYANRSFRIQKGELIQSSNDAQNQDAFSAQPAEDQAAQMQVEQSSQSSNDAQPQDENRMDTDESQTISAQTAQATQPQGVVNGSSSSNNSRNNTNLPSNPPPNPPTNGILNSTAQDVHGLMLNQLHDSMHDYMDTSSRTQGFNNFAQDVQTTLGGDFWKSQTGGFGGTVVLPLLQNNHTHLDNVFVPPGFENQHTKLLQQALQEIESVYRPKINMYYRYFYSRFIVHLFNSKTVDFNLKPNFELFMMQNAVGQKEDIGVAIHDKFVEACFFLFQYEYENSEEDFIKFYNNISKTDSTKITGQKKLVEYFLNNSQNGGAPKKTAADKKAEAEIHDRATDFLPFVIDNLRNRFIPYYEKTYNHFLRAQQDVMDKVLDGGKPIDFDEALIHQAIDIIMLNHSQNEKIEINNSLISFSGQFHNTTQNTKYIIDNAGNIDNNFKDRTICCQSTLNDGIIAFSHACGTRAGITIIPADPVEINSDMDIMIRRDNNLYIQYTRTAIGQGDHEWTVTWVSNGKVFDATRETVIKQRGIHNVNTNVSLEAEQCFIDAVTKVKDNWNTIKNLTGDQRKNSLSDTFYSVLVFKSLGDILQELNCVLKYGGYKNKQRIYDNTKNVEPYNNQGDAQRLMFSNDRPSATRILWYLYNGGNLGSNCNGESSNWSQSVNQFACGGLYYPTGNGCFMYDPSMTTLQTKIVYTKDDRYPPLLCHKNELTIGKYLTNYRSHIHNNTVRHSGAKINQLYQVYVIICPNNTEYIKINYLQLQHKDFYYYSSIILNVINERLINEDMTINRINIFPDDRADNYYYHVNDHELMTINIIEQGNYFIYKRSYGDYVHFLGDELIFKKRLIGNEIGTCNNNTQETVFKNDLKFYRGGKSIIENPNYDPQQFMNIKNFPSVYNNSLAVLNSELCQFTWVQNPNNAGYNFVVTLSDAYSTVVTLNQPNTENAITNSVFFVPREPILNTDYDCRDRTPSQPSTPPPVELQKDAKIKFKTLLDNIRTNHYNTEVTIPTKAKDALKLEFQINENNENPEISITDFQQKINNSQNNALKKLKNLSNQEINTLFEAKEKSSSKRTEAKDGSSSKRRKTGQTGGATEENMNPVIYAGVSIIVLLGALTGLKL